MGVRLRERRGDPPTRGGKHHRSRHVAASAEHDVGPSPREDTVASRRRGKRVQSRAGLREPRLPRQPAHAKSVELVAAFRNEPRLGATRRPGERHPCSARDECLRHCERGQDVSGRPPGCYQARWRFVLRHCPRC